MAIAANEINALVQQFPSGKFGFVGWRVPGELLYMNTSEELAKAKAAGITQFLKTRVFPTKEDAIAARTAWLEANPEYVNVGSVVDANGNAVEA